MAKYIPRTVDKKIELYLEAFGAILIQGPKWCGKSTTGEQYAKSELRLQDYDILIQSREIADTKPSLLLKGKTPRLIDEWQTIPQLWDTVRSEVDKRKEPGQFILTGSNTIKREEILHSGIGRIARVNMLPMSLFESGDSTGQISISELFDNPDIDIDGAQSNLSIERLIFTACRGGWPTALLRKSEAAQLVIAQSYVDDLCEIDMTSTFGVQRDANLVRAILRSYARNISTLAKLSAIHTDVLASSETCSINTLADYINDLKRLFIIQDLDAWSPSIRSATAIRSTPKREFIDPSIATAALGLTPQKLLMDLNTFGFIFETLCIRDLKAYTSVQGSRISYYHDRYGLEADAVLTLNDGRYALIEFKLGNSGIDNGAKNLLKLKSLITEYNKKNPNTPMNEPNLLIVITGGQMAYRRNDGVYIIPIGTLKD